MENQKEDRIYNILSFILLTLVTIFSIVRFPYLPQFIDGYYHLSCANGFIKSGGWVGIAWWDFAPLGRPHLYPPLYHFIIVFLKTIGVEGLTAIRLTEISIVPLFFFSLWYIFKKEISIVFAFFFLLISTSFFSFYTSVSANLPASIALILSIFSGYFLKKKKIVSSILFLVLAFYTHAAIPWITLISLIFIACLSKDYGKSSLKVILVSLCLASFLLFHQIRYFNYINLSILKEVMFSHFSIFILVSGIISFFLNFKREDFFRLFFMGLILGSIIVFFKYPYRLFSSQGMLGWIFYSSYLCEQVVRIIKSKWINFVFLILVVYLFFFHSTIDLEEGKAKFNLFSSTYHYLSSGKFTYFLEYASLFFPQHYLPVANIIKTFSEENEIIVSNLNFSSQVFSSLTNRPTSRSILSEVKGFRDFSVYRVAKIIIWVKPFTRKLAYLQEKLDLNKLYENDMFLVYFNPHCSIKVLPIRAKISFIFISSLFLFCLFIFFLDNAKIVYKI
ncbi:MAG: hypothetical protein NC822_01670 [Candidatus Omnitrophica bacterium]|nr:hypothetical protein [Candidatus Omnitrophota bacterium]MCM8827056.1 hypothetical protein [Candidatus Omnitrophota bacterium]